MDTNDKLLNANDLMSDTEAITLEALANVDMARIVSMIEQDCISGEMSIGQRKSAHLLLKYYAPQKATITQSNQSLSTLDSVPIATIIHMIESIDARIIPPSVQVPAASAGVHDIDLVLSDHPIKNINLIPVSESVNSDTSLIDASKRAGKIL